MINWYIPLYLGVILILYLFPYIGSFPNLQVYSEGRSGFGGLSTGTNLLLSRLISGDLLALAIISVLHFGVMGGIGFAFIVLTSLLIFVLIASKLSKNNGNRSILDLVREQSTPYYYRYHLVVLLWINLGNMLLQLAALDYLLGSYFHQSSYRIIFLIVLFSFTYSGLGGFEAINKGAKPQMLLVFFTTALITVSVFLEKGLRTTYQDIVLLPIHPINFMDSILIFFTGISILTAQYLLDHSLWHGVYRLKSIRRYSILLITIFCVFAISMGHSAITIYGMSQKILTGNNILQVLEKNNSPVLLNLYVITVFIAVLSSYSLNLFSSVILFSKFQGTDFSSKETNPIKLGYSFSLLVNLLIGAFFLLMPKLSLIGLISALGIFNASMVISYLMTLFQTTRAWRLSACIGLLSFIFGIFIYTRFKYPYTPLLCLSFSITLEILISSLQKLQKIIKT